MALFETLGYGWLYSVGMTMTIIINAFYFLNIGILIGCLVNTLGSKCRAMTGRLDKGVFESAEVLLSKYRELKELN